MGGNIMTKHMKILVKNLGTGLGLSISHGIINDHHGTIRIDTKEGQYCEFIVELPVDNGWEVIS